MERVAWRAGPPSPAAEGAKGQSFANKHGHTAPVPRQMPKRSHGGMGGARTTGVIATTGPARVAAGTINYFRIRVHCTVGTALSIEKAGLPSAVIAGLKHLASLHNPVFYERQKLRLSTYRTPRFIRCYEEDLTHLHLPRGIMEDLQAIVTAAGSKLVVTDRRPISALREFRFRGTLSPIQRKVVHEVASYEQGVLVAPPGIGKTVMACAIIAQRNVPTLVLVHRQPLLNQWRNHVQEWLCLAPSEIGEIRGGMCRAGQAVDLAMIQSLQRHEDLPAFFGRYGLLVVDECHHVPAFSFESCLKQAPVRYVLGLTATPYRRDGLQELITMQCGPI